MKKITSLPLFLTLSFVLNVVAQAQKPGIGPTTTSSNGITAASDFKLTVIHGGFDGAKIKSTSNFSVVDIDAFNGDNAVRFFTNGVGKWLIGNDISNNENFRIYNFNTSSSPFSITSSGRVGIGTTTPDYPVEISVPSGGYTLGITSGTANNWLAFNNSSGYICYAGTFTSPTQMDFGTSGSGTDVNIVTAASPRMTIKFNGYVGIGTTAPNATLEVQKTTDPWGTAVFWGTNYANFFNYSTVEDTYIRGGKSTSKVNIGDVGQAVGLGGTALGAYPVEVHCFGAYGLGIYSSGNTGHWELYTNPNSTSNLYLYGNNIYRGVFDGTTGAYTSASDKTLKTNIVPLNSILGKVMKLEPSSYQFIDNNPTNKTSIGLIAQDVETLFPEFVYKNTDRDGKEIRSMDYAGMSVVAIKAIQEQQAIIDALTARIAALEAKLK